MLNDEIVAAHDIPSGTKRRFLDIVVRCGFDVGMTNHGICSVLTQEDAPAACRPMLYATGASYAFYDDAYMDVQILVRRRDGARMNAASPEAPRVVDPDSAE